MPLSRTFRLSFIALFRSQPAFNPARVLLARLASRPDWEAVQAVLLDVPLGNPERDIYLMTCLIAWRLPHNHPQHREQLNQLADYLKHLSSLAEEGEENP